MKIQRVTLSDINAVVILFNDYRIFYGKPSDLQGAREFLSERIEKNESTIFLSLDGENNPTGFVQLYPIFSSTRMKRIWLLNDLYVGPAFRGTGHAVALMDAAKTYALETQSCGLILETAKNNLVANRLYQRIGFDLDGDHNYYSWNC